MRITSIQQINALTLKIPDNVSPTVELNLAEYSDIQKELMNSSCHIRPITITANLNKHEIVYVSNGKRVKISLAGPEAESK